MQEEIGLHGITDAKSAALLAHDFLYQFGGVKKVQNLNVRFQMRAPLNSRFCIANHRKLKL